jgi:hypothetical protein
MHSVAGGCHCGNIRVELQLPREPGAYAPRACDCDFCRKHGAAYVSDPYAALTLWIRNERDTGRYRQGSGQAEMLLCRECGVLVGALHRADGRLYGVVNATAIDGGRRFGSEQPVSPQTLSAEDKLKRWREIWCSNVSIISGQPAGTDGAWGSQHE